MPIKNHPGFVPRSFPFQPDYYTDLFGRICAVFTHPTKKVTLFIEVNADVWNHTNFLDASGDLLVQYQANCRRTLGQPHKTLKAALEQIQEHLSNPHFGESFQYPPEFRKHSHRYANPNLNPKRKRLRRKGNGTRFILTDEDKTILRPYGYTDSDFRQIEEAANRSTYSTGEGSSEKAINIQEAIGILGREEFLSGIARSAFHRSCSRENPATGESVWFDSGIIFK